MSNFIDIVLLVTKISDLTFFYTEKHTVAFGNRHIRNCLVSQYACSWIKLSKALLNTTICASQGIIPSTVSEFLVYKYF